MYRVTNQARLSILHVCQPHGLPDPSGNAGHGLERFKYHNKVPDQGNYLHIERSPREIHISDVKITPHDDQSVRTRTRSISRDPDKVPRVTVLDLKREPMVHVTIMPVFLIADRVASYSSNHRPSEQGAYR